MALPKKLCSEIITAFELQVSDITELSATEELAILNRVNQKICSDRPWEFLRTTVAGTISSDATSYYITPPTDFGYFAENNTYTDNAMSIYNNAVPKVIFVISGTAYMPYQIINFADRRQYVNRSGFAYYDAVNNIIRFTGTPQTTSYEFDYIKVPALLTTSDYPIFPGQFHDILTFGMSVENEILQLSPKATSYAAENQAKYEQMMLDMQFWNANLNMS